MTEFFLDQHGCAKNQVDGETIVALLSRKGFAQTFDAERADIIIINSCGFIEQAKRESIDAVMRAREFYPHAKIILAGCLAQRYAQELKDSLPEADAIFGNGDISLAPKIVARTLRGERPVLAPAQTGIFCARRKTLLSYPGSAYVKITEGCSNHCSFCAIPLIRGELRSRAAREIVSEIKSLVSRGVREINLVGQDIAAYGADRRTTLCDLLKKISAIGGSFAVRMLYIHPDHFDRAILRVMKKDKRLLPYFDIPFQSGSDKIISAMNRKNSAQDYVQLVQDIRAEFPDAAIRTTFLVGFPGETEKDAADSLRFLKKIKSDWSGCFCYSREENTPAYSMKPRTPKKIARQRAAALESAQSKITAKKLRARCGKEYNVLVEEVLAGDEGLAIGRAWFQAPEVDGSFVIRYDKNDEAQDSAVRAGAVVRVRADGVRGVDIDSHFVSA